MRIRLGLAFVILVLGHSSWAYEEDVHFGLTHWLALQAGFSASEAGTLAEHNVAFDHGPFDATKLVMHFACFGRNKQASETVRDHHFPSAAPLPSDPRQRAVAPGSGEALLKSEDRILRPRATALVTLQEFGAGLHPLQDSWSHQGVPGSPLDVPWLCDRQLSWGHPDLRGGWREHTADLTARHPVTETENMASRTYAQLCRFRQASGNPPCDKPFDALRPAVQDFAKADSKTAKDAWFRARDMSDTEFLDLVNLPSGPNYISVSALTGKTRMGTLAVPYSRAGSLPNLAPAQFMLKFFNAWFTTRGDLTEVIKRFMAPELFRRGQLVPSGDAVVDYRAVELLLHFWRVREHGDAVARAGHHGITELRTDILGDLRPWFVERSLPYEDVAHALLPLDANLSPLLAGAAKTPDGREVWIGLARLRHAPAEKIVVAATRVGPEFRVVGIGSFVEH